MSRKRILHFSAICVALALPAASATSATDPEESWWRRNFIDPQDGKLDASVFLESSHGFVPMGSIITDPAVGYGASLGLLFIRPNATPASGSVRPDLSAIAGFATDNGSWGAGLADSSLWRGGTLKTLAATFSASANLNLHGGEGENAVDEPRLRYNLRARGALTEASAKLPESRTWLGLRYLFADVEVRFEGENDSADIDAGDRDQTLSGLTPILSYDSRDNLFTPTKGMYAEGAVAVFNEALGGDRDFEIVSLSGIWFQPLADDLTLGLKANLGASFGEVPFYLRPYVQLRGIESLGLQAENVADAEAELRWQHWNRWSLVVFAGGGMGWKGLTDFDHERSVATGGLGMRYLVARRMGLHLGFDIGFGPADPILYFQFGSAWFRP